HGAGAGQGRALVHGAGGYGGDASHTDGREVGGADRRRMPRLSDLQSDRYRAGPRARVARHRPTPSTRRAPRHAAGRRVQFRVPGRARPSSGRSSQTVHRLRGCENDDGAGAAAAAAAGQSSRVMRLRNIKVIRAAAFLAGCALLVTLFVRLGPARIVSLVAALGWNFPVIVAIFAAHELVRTM